METKKDILWRIYIVFFFILLFGGAIIFRVVDLQFFQADYWKSKAESLNTAYRNIEAVRGNIYASDGSLLATSIPIYELRLDLGPDAVKDEVFSRNIDSLSLCLSNLFKDKSGRDYRRELTEAHMNGDRYYLLQRNVSYNELKQVRTFPMFRMGRYRGGLIVTEKSRRERPFQVLASRTIGYDIDSIKPVGLEGAYSEYLRGTSGKRLMQKLSGDVWMPINDDNEVEPQDGKDVVTTIDINIQDVAEHALLTQLAKHNAEHGCAVLMEVSTGEIKAIANLTREDTIGNYNEYYNYAIGESTEPGSTFKLASLIVAMEDGKIDLSDTVDLENGKHIYYDRPMSDSHKPEKRKVSVQQAFEISSNVGISKLIYHAYARNQQSFVDGLLRLHLNDMLGLSIPGETPPLIKSTKDKDWSGVTLPWMSIGYEVRLTPMQILTLYNAVANNGKMVKPMFVKEVRQRGKLVKPFYPSVIKDSLCSAETIAKAKRLLEGVVENGTASNLRNPVYRIAGKTGTAQMANEKYGYKYRAQTTYQASFVGYFPADNPKYSCIVVVNAPSNDVYYAAQVAGPIFKEIADKVYATSLEIHKSMEAPAGTELKNIPLVKGASGKEAVLLYRELGICPVMQNTAAEWVTAARKDSLISLNEKKKTNGVPDVTGMGIKDAVYILENYGLRVKINGRGSITGQSLEPGSKAEKGTEIILQLS